MNEETKNPSNLENGNKDEVTNNKKNWRIPKIKSFSVVSSFLKTTSNKINEHTFNSPFYIKYVKKWIGLGLFALFLLSWIVGFIGYAGANNWNFGLAAQHVFVNSLINNFIGITAVLIGVLVVIGYRLAGRSWNDSILGFIKGAIGVLILSFGSGILIATARPIFLALGNLGRGGGTDLVPLDPYFGLTSAQNFFGGIGGSTVSIIYLALVIGFVTNIVLVGFKRFTNLRTIFVTGHIMIQQSAIFAVTLYLVVFVGNGVTGQAAFWGASVLAGLGAGIYWAYGSSLNYYATQKVTDNGGFAIGHQQMIAISIAYKVGKYFGRPEQDAENRKLSKFFRVFEDNIFTQSIMIFIIFLILVLVIQFGTNNDANRFYVLDKNSGIYVVNTAYKININDQKGDFGQWSAGGKIGQPDFVSVWWFTSFILGVLKVVGSVLVITYGVRIFVTELQQSFQGISDRLIPNASVAVDIAAAYGYSPNSVTFGFVSGTIGQFMTVGLLYGIKQGVPDFPVVIPIFITLFFNSGALGIYANKSGGYKAAIIVPFLFAIAGILISAGSIYGVTKFFTQLQAANGNLNLSGLNGGAALKSVPKPWSVGYNGMADPNIFFGALNALISINSKLAVFWIILWYFLLLVLAQLIKFNDHDKPTYLRNLYDHQMNHLASLIKPKLVRRVMN